MLDRTTITDTRPPVVGLYLTLLDDRRIIASNIRSEYGIHRHNQWEWIVGNIVGWFGCDADDVSCLETEDGDMIAVKGSPVAELVEN